MVNWRWWKKDKDGARPTGVAKWPRSAVDDVVRQLEPWIAQHRRKAWIPIVSDSPQPGTSRSQFGGLAWLPEGEQWPKCGACSRDMHLFLQLDLSTLPAELEGRYGEGLLQMFYCTRNDCDLHRESWQPFDPGHLVRILPPVTNGGIGTFDESPFQLRVISGWKEVVDLPHPQDHDELGLYYDYDFENETLSINCLALGVQIGPLPLHEADDEDNDVAEAVGQCLEGDKLAGWPNWVQGSEYPVCPACGERMQLVFQIDSEDSIPFMFGDMGTGHITQCPMHKDQLAFGWACC